MLLLFRKGNSKGQKPGSYRSPGRFLSFPLLAVVRESAREHRHRSLLCDCLQPLILVYASMTKQTTPSAVPRASMMRAGHLFSLTNLRWKRAGKMKPWRVPEIAPGNKVVKSNVGFR
jgi:hypothetical protein